VTTLVLAAHGSRDPRFDVTSRRVADAVRIALPDVRVELAYLDLTAPLLTDVLGELSGDVVVVPLLFGDGFHSKVDLPALLDDAVVANPALRVRQTPVVGRYSPVPALADRLSEAGLGDRDGVLIIPREAEAEAITLALEKVRGENQVREAIEGGMSASDAFAKFGIM